MGRRRRRRQFLPSSAGLEQLFQGIEHRAVPAFLPPLQTRGLSSKKTTAVSSFSMGRNAAEYAVRPCTEKPFLSEE